MELLRDYFQGGILLLGWMKTSYPNIKYFIHTLQKLLLCLMGVYSFLRKNVEILIITNNHLKL